MVAPYVLWLKQQLAAERKAKKKGGGKKQTAAAATPATATAASAGASSSSSPKLGPQQLTPAGGKDAGATAALLEMLSGSGVLADAALGDGAPPPPPPPAALPAPAAGEAAVATGSRRKGKEREPRGAGASAAATKPSRANRVALGVAPGGRGKQVSVLQRPAGRVERQREGAAEMVTPAARGHPLLDFAFDVDAVLSALSEGRPLPQRQAGSAAVSF